MPPKQTPTQKEGPTRVIPIREARGLAAFVIYIISLDPSIVTLITFHILTPRSGCVNC